MCSASASRRSCRRPRASRCRNNDAGLRLAAHSRAHGNPADLGTVAWVPAFAGASGILFCAGRSHLMTVDPIAIDTDVLVIGSGAAGMYAAIEAARNGARVFMIDRSLIGRGGATIMAQMTVAAALGEEVPDAPGHHYADTIAAGRGLCDEKLAELLCDGAARRRVLDRHGIRAVLSDRPFGAAARRHGSDHVGSVPLQARRSAS